MLRDIDTDCLVITSTFETTASFTETAKTYIKNNKLSMLDMETVQSWVLLITGKGDSPEFPQIAGGLNIVICGVMRIVYPGNLTLTKQYYTHLCFSSKKGEEGGDYRL